jgi:hypothetical protein
MEGVTGFFRSMIHHAWSLFIVVTILNALFLRLRSKPFIIRDPALKLGYDHLFKAVLIYGNIPWVVMAINDLTGITNSIFDYMSLRTLNPGVLLWFGTVITLWILGTRWIFFKNGATFLADHPGLFTRSAISGATPSATMIKVIWGLAMFSGLAFIMMALFGPMAQ